MRLRWESPILGQMLNLEFQEEQNNTIMNRYSVHFIIN